MSVTRRGALGLLGGALAAPSPVFAAAKRSYDLQSIAIARGLWMVEGSTDYFSDENGGAIVNVALLQGESGLIIIDTGPSRRYGEALARLAQGLDARGVSAVVNTHHHPDHFFGNQVFREKPIFALGETRQLAETHGDGFADSMYRILGDWMRGTEPVPPNAPLEGGEALIDGRGFELLPLSGHTEADLALLDRDTGTMVAGDLAFLDRAPTTPSADLTLWRQSIDLMAGVKAAAILPGHGPLDRTGTSLHQTRAYLDWLEGTLREDARAGLDMVEVMATELPPEWATMGAMPAEFHRSVVHLFPEIERAELPLAPSTE